MVALTRQAARKLDQQSATADPPPACYICLQQGGPVFFPCRCRGTIAVHQTCLLTWLQKIEAKTDAGWKCSICQTPFNVQSHYRLNMKRENWDVALGLGLGILFSVGLLMWAFERTYECLMKWQTSWSLNGKDGNFDKLVLLTIVFSVLLSFFMCILASVLEFCVVKIPYLVREPDQAALAKQIPKDKNEVNKGMNWRNLLNRFVESVHYFHEFRTAPARFVWAIVMAIVYLQRLILVVYVIMLFKMHVMSQLTELYNSDV
eukprot:Colp12_sorted_trinity150504_noHs@9510